MIVMHDVVKLFSVPDKNMKTKASLYCCFRILTVKLKHLSKFRAFINTETSSIINKLLWKKNTYGVSESVILSSACEQFTAVVETILCVLFIFFCNGKTPHKSNTPIQS